MNILAITLIFGIGFIGGMAAMALLLEKALEEYKEERLGKLNKDIEKAIEDLKGLNERSSKESELFKKRHGRNFELAIEALEKQIPKKPICESKLWPDGQEYIKKSCPSCREDMYDTQEYCNECGQKLDWEVEN